MYFSEVLVLDIIDYAVSQGADKTDLYQKLQLQLDKQKDHSAKMSYEKMSQVLRLVGQTLNDEFLGLHIGEQLMLKATKQVDDIMHSSPTVEEAFSSANNYSRLISDALQGSLVKSQNYTQVNFEVHPNWKLFQNQIVQQIIDLTLVCTLKSIYWLTGRNYPPVEIQFPFAAPKKRNEYYRVFDCSLKFNKQSAAIIFPNQILNLSIPTNNTSLHNYLKLIADEEIVNFKSEPRLIIEIKKRIIHNLPRKVTIEFIAIELQMTSRTLQRKLQLLNTNFKKIEKDILIKLAKKIIVYEERNIEETSYLLGFSEASAFIRFFKKEMMVTPKRYKMMLSKNLSN